MSGARQVGGFHASTNMQARAAMRLDADLVPAGIPLKCLGPHGGGELLSFVLLGVLLGDRSLPARDRAHAAGRPCEKQEEVDVNIEWCSIQGGPVKKAVVCGFLSGSGGALVRGPSTSPAASLEAEAEENTPARGHLSLTYFWAPLTIDPTPTLGPQVRLLARRWRTTQDTRSRRAP
jgi:hypothetical protein